MKLPNSDYLPINYLSAVFNDTTNSYKFYWFLGILERLNKFQEKEMQIDDIINEMIGEVWYPINYFKLSFGKQDKLEEVVVSLKNKLRLQKDIKKDELISYFKVKNNKEIINKTFFKLK